jgi:hypothetical protein
MKDIACTQRGLISGRKWWYGKTGALPNGVLQETALQAWSYQSVLLVMFSGLAKGKSVTSFRNNQTIINHTVLKLERIK